MLRAKDRDTVDLFSPSFSAMAVSFSSIFYILLSGTAGLGLYAVQKLRKEGGAK